MVISTLFLFMNQMVKVIIYKSLSLFNMSHMFCKSGILIFIFAENNYSIYAHTMLIKTPLLHQSFGPRVLLSLSLSQAISLEHRGFSEFTFLPKLLRPSWEGLLCLHPIERVPEASVNRASPVQGFIGFLHKPRNISLFLSPLLSYRSTLDHQVLVH